MQEMDDGSFEGSGDGEGQKETRHRVRRLSSVDTLKQLRIGPMLPRSEEFD